MGIQVGDGSKKGGMDEINVTPLIDVVLVLLIIFMVLTPITIQNMASHLPPVDDTEEPPPPPDQPPDQLMVAVYADGTTALNLKPFPDDVALKDDLTKRIRARAKKNVFIDAHPDANYGRVVEVMDLVRETGADKVGFAELKTEGPARLVAGATLPTDPTGQSTAAGAGAATPATP